MIEKEGGTKSYLKIATYPTTLCQRTISNFPFSSVVWAIQINDSISNATKSWITFDLSRSPPSEHQSAKAMSEYSSSRERRVSSIARVLSHYHGEDAQSLRDFLIRKQSLVRIFIKFVHIPVQVAISTPLSDSLWRHVCAQGIHHLCKFMFIPC
uniref:Uncharacterized protein n=1 Tax=Proboscia inermis TaxID=420281 RepID=A0A7S0GEU2_9STRA|mmetsp:Transcript_26502/g.26892  ORF Transcript_26502/g.26892 Transcript_26502/m.26892 type:complete len:154 (+) Transcript_26502:448-909(+)